MHTSNTVKPVEPEQLSQFKLIRVSSEGGNTCTGSVTFGAGSDDPPPNNVEMVLPSSKSE